MDSLLKFSTVVLAALTVASVILAVTFPLPFEGVYSLRGLANVSGFIALFLIVASGIMMLFKKNLLGLTKYPEGLRLVHLLVSAVGGLFLLIHVALLLFFPITLPVLFGYLGTGVALVVWITGMVMLAERHARLIYHALLSVVGIALIALHAFSAGIYRDLQISGVALVIIGIVLVVIIEKPYHDLARMRRVSGRSSGGAG